MNEYSALKSVVVGIADDCVIPSINPTIKLYEKEGTLPNISVLKEELERFARALEGEGITVHRPRNIIGQYQIYARDIAFVIGDTIVVSNMKEPSRQKEIAGIQYVLKEIGADNIVKLPSDAIVEGGDVIIHNGVLFVGIGERTNQAGYEFLKEMFSAWDVIPLKLQTSEDHVDHTLHLDCAFQPVGGKFAIICEDAFAEVPLKLYDIFGKENLIIASQDEKVEMAPNIFSIGEQKVVSDASFERLNAKLRDRGITVVEVSCPNMAKLGGFFRCSTLPLVRE